MNQTPESIIQGMRFYCLASTMCELRLGEHFTNGAAELSGLARSLKCDERRLGRLMRGFVWAGFLDQNNDEFTLTDLGSAVLGGPFSFTSEFFYHPWLYLKSYLESGISPYEAHHGKPLFEHLNDEPEKKEMFYFAMMSSTGADGKEIADALSFPEGSVVVDVGGGHGQLAKIIKSKHPHVHCRVVDLPILEDEAAIYLEGTCEFIPADMFSELPIDGDFYFLKWILHDWDDQPAADILKHCASRMKETGKVLIVERIFDDSTLSSIEMVNRDLNMLVLNGGRERTLDEYRDLVEQAGLMMDEVVALKSGFSVIVATKQTEV